jgi:hypothetical protein
MEERVRSIGTRAALVLAGALVALALGVAPATARDRVITVPTPPEPGPAELNHVTVHQFGPKSAKHVLVLMPGTIGGAGDFTLDARCLVKHHLTCRSGRPTGAHRRSRTPLSLRRP